MIYIEKHEWEEKYNEATGRADFFEPNSLVIPINSAILLTRMLLATSITQALAEERERVVEAMMMKGIEAKMTPFQTTVNQYLRNRAEEVWNCPHLPPRP